MEYGGQYVYCLTRTIALQVFLLFLLGTVHHAHYLRVC